MLATEVDGPGCGLQQLLLRLCKPQLLFKLAIPDLCRHALGPVMLNSRFPRQCHGLGTGHSHSVSSRTKRYMSLDARLCLLLEGTRYIPLKDESNLLDQSCSCDRWQTVGLKHVHQCVATNESATKK